MLRRPGEIRTALKQIQKEIETGKFKLTGEHEDVHLAIEQRLIGLARASPAEAQGLRLAIRNVLLAMGVPLPAEPEGPCELHGPSCPEPGQG